MTRKHTQATVQMLRAHTWVTNDTCKHTQTTVQMTSRGPC